MDDPDDSKPPPPHPITYALQRVERHLADLARTHGELFGYSWMAAREPTERIYAVNLSGNVAVVRAAPCGEILVPLMVCTLDEQLAFLSQVDVFLGVVHRYYEELPARKIAALQAVDAALAKVAP